MVALRHQRDQSQPSPLVNGVMGAAAPAAAAEGGMRFHPPMVASSMPTRMTS